MARLDIYNGMSINSDGITSETNHHLWAGGDFQAQFLTELKEIDLN